ncbi:caspase family protein [Streptomyces sp. NPDC096339]|uniref:caspase, EACC1-associated type n=1 Tax=Streptomyces sp. NPDC096339 TaxID=3366086 RepID=UPI00380BCE7C
MTSPPGLPDPGSSRVVLVGVSDYEHLEPLPAVAHSLLDLTEALRSPRLWGVPAHHSAMLHNPAGPEEVLDAVRAAAADARDTLLLYYAGHGLPDPFSGELNLTLPGSAPEKQETLLAYEWLRRPLMASRARRRIVILDSCYSGRILPRTLTDQRLADKAGIEGVFLMTASASHREALSPPGLRHTAFSGELLSILRSGIPDAGPTLDLRTIFAELDHRLTRSSLPRPQSNNRNTASSLGLVWNLHGFTAAQDAAAGHDGVVGPSAAGGRHGGLFIDGYEIVERAGEGEDTETWLALDRHTGARVAVTALREELVGDPVAVARFHAWQESLHSGDPHPAIARVHAQDVTRHWRGPRPYVVLEYLPGTVRELLATGPLPLARALSVTRGVLEGLRHDRAAGDGHAVLSPDALRTDPEGRVMIVRFRRPVHGDPTPDAWGPAFPTAPGPVHHVSPEELMRRPTDGRSDVYAVGCLLHELLCGSPPFDAEHAVTIAHGHMTGEPPRLSAKLGAAAPAPRWDTFLSKALAKDPQARYRDADDMLRSITACEEAPLSLAEALSEAFRQPELDFDASVVGARWVLRALHSAAAEAAAGAPLPRRLHLRLLLPAYDSGPLLASQRTLLRRENETAVRSLLALLDSLAAPGRDSSVRAEVRRTSAVAPLFLLNDAAFTTLTESQPLRRWDPRADPAAADTARTLRRQFDAAWRTALPS